MAWTKAKTTVVVDVAVTTTNGAEIDYSDQKGTIMKRRCSIANITCIFAFLVFPTLFTVGSQADEVNLKLMPNGAAHVMGAHLRWTNGFPFALALAHRSVSGASPALCKNI